MATEWDKFENVSGILMVETKYLNESTYTEFLDRNLKESCNNIMPKLMKENREVDNYITLSYLSLLMNLQQHYNCYKYM